MRFISQPGPAPTDRIVGVRGDGHPFAFDLAPGEQLLDAVTRNFAAAGYASGVMTLNGGAFCPLAYVIPAVAETSDHAAFYSQPYRPEGIVRLHDGAGTFGTRDGAPFLHCHAFWRTPDGSRGGGHILTDETVLADTVHVEAIGLTGMAFAAAEDAETHFKLFGPVAAGSASNGRFHALRLRPNQDISEALEGFCRTQGIAGARIHGGVGSLIGAHYADGTNIEAFATEMFIRSGHIVATAGTGRETTIDIATVDLDGALSEGRLRRGENPILMTLEVVLEAE